MTTDLDDLIDRGGERFHAGDLDGAIAEFRAAAALAPDDRLPWYNLGVACLHQGDRVGGIHVVTEAGDHVVSGNDVWYRQAIEAFTRALAIDPTHTPTLVMRGHAWRNRLDDQRARADFTEAARLGDRHAPRLLAELDEP